MTAKFHCEETFTVPSRRLFVLAGEIMDGVVRCGMTIQVPTGEGTRLSCVVNSVELISTADKWGRVGLAIECADDTELQSMSDLNIRDVECVVIGPAS